ncbi:hypothetical protein JCM30237_19120 [Halolamina litorea]|uniref:Uncharacterized protein n=1 Tax=Halolamina litorea TaxID=1515593 RepID=A0ABD6BV98_9EURY|nr:hypothetical protein [Halolamina litorea]
MALPDRFEPWHVLLVAAFLVGAGGSLAATTGIAFVNLATAVLSGLLWAFAVYVFVGTFRNYVTSYADTGGSLWDPRFLAPFVVGAVAAVAVLAWRLTESAFSGPMVTEALTVGFWAFVLAMVVVLTASYVVAGYREARP